MKDSSKLELKREREMIKTLQREIWWDLITGWVEKRQGEFCVHKLAANRNVKSTKTMIRMNSDSLKSRDSGTSKRKQKAEQDRTKESAQGCAGTNLPPWGQQVVNSWWWGPGPSCALVHPHHTSHREVLYKYFLNKVLWSNLNPFSLSSRISWLCQMPWWNSCPLS